MKGTGTRPLGQITPPTLGCQPKWGQITPPTPGCQPKWGQITPPSLVCQPKWGQNTPPSLVCQPKWGQITPPTLVCQPKWGQITPPPLVCQPKWVQITPPTPGCQPKHGASGAQKLLLASLGTVPIIKNRKRNFDIALFFQTFRYSGKFLEFGDIALSFGYLLSEQQCN